MTDNALGKAMPGHMSVLNQSFNKAVCLHCIKENKSNKISREEKRTQGKQNWRKHVAVSTSVHCPQDVWRELGHFSDDNNNLNPR